MVVIALLLQEFGRLKCHQSLKFICGYGLRRRGLDVNSDCVECPRCLETIKHIFLLWPFVREISKIKAIKLGINNSWPNSFLALCTVSRRRRVEKEFQKKWDSFIMEVFDAFRKREIGEFFLILLFLLLAWCRNLTPCVGILGRCWWW